MQNIPYLWKKKGLKIFTAQLLKLVLKYMYIYDRNHIPRNEPPSQYRKSTMFHMWNLGFSDSLGERIPLNARNIGASTLDPSSVKLLLGQISYIIERHTLRSCNSYKFMVQLHNVIQLYLFIKFQYFESNWDLMYWMPCLLIIINDDRHDIFTDFKQNCIDHISIFNTSVYFTRDGNMHFLRESMKEKVGFRHLVNCFDVYI